MPPKVPHAPEHTCVNYPLCDQSQCRKHIDGCRVRDAHCSVCLQNALCKEVGCSLHTPPDVKVRGSAPLTAHGFCVPHFREHQHDPIRVWKQCVNAKVGCHRLSIAKKGGKCFACSQDNLPCKNAISGCANHVAGAASIRSLCECQDHDHVPCPFRSKHATAPSSTQTPIPQTATPGAPASTPTKPPDLRPSVAFAPERSCANYPFCTRTQTQPRVDGKRIWHNYCSECLRNCICKAKKCTAHVAPSKPLSGNKVLDTHGLCSIHAASLEYKDILNWSTCLNALP